MRPTINEESGCLRKKYCGADVNGKIVLNIDVLFAL
jgi:hypothetical protein